MYGYAPGGYGYGYGGGGGIISLAIVVFIILVLFCSVGCGGCGPRNFGGCGCC